MNGWQAPPVRLASAVADAGKWRKRRAGAGEGVKNSAALQEISSYYPCGMPGLIAKTPLMNCSHFTVMCYRLVAGGAGSNCLRRSGPPRWRKGFISLVPSVLSLGCGLACWR